MLGEGVAKMRKAIVEGLETSVQSFDQIADLGPHQVMDLLLITQFFDYISEVGGGRFSAAKKEEKGKQHNFVYHNPGALRELRKTMSNLLSADRGGGGERKIRGTE